MSPLANRGSSFFYLPTHYSDIYSFPTRRSSDLGGILQETQHPFGIDARSFGEQLWRELFLAIRSLVAGHRHERTALTRDELVAAHAVVLLYDPPAFLNIAAIIQWAVLIARWKRAFLAAHE